MSKLRFLLFYLYCFSIPFQSWNPFNSENDFLITKITTSLYILASLTNIKSNFSIKFDKSIFWLISFFLLLTFMNYINQNAFTNRFLNTPFLLNILVFILAVNHDLKNKGNIILRGSLFYIIGIIIITIMFFLGINNETNLEGRDTIFGMNQNSLGINLVIANLFILILTYYNKLNFNFGRGFYIIAFIMINVFIVGTASRIAFISLFLSFFVFFTFKGKSFIGKLFYAINILLISFLSYSLFFTNNYLFTRLHSSFIKGDLSSRDDIWILALDFIYQNPYFGFGETGYIYAYSFLPQEYSVPHNVIIEILCYTGFVGLFLFFKFFVPILYKCLYALKKGDRSSIVLIIPIIGLILSGQIFHLQIVWLIFAYIFANHLKLLKT